MHVRGGDERVGGEGGGRSVHVAATPVGSLRLIPYMCIYHEP
jgi:hypothetical protein